MSNSDKIFDKAMECVRPMDNGKIKNVWLYPVTIISDRYGGVYSGGAWTAWPVETWEVPDDARGDDGDCSWFWQHHSDSKIGKGKTPDEALADLNEKWDVDPSREGW